MSSFYKQILKDSTTETVVKFTGFIDAAANGPQTDAANTTLAMASLVGAYDTNGSLRSVTGGAALSLYKSNVRKIVWAIGSSPANAAIQVLWKGGGTNANSVMLMLPAGSGQLDFTDGTTGGAVSTDPSVGLGANAGDIVLASSGGLAAGSYSIVLSLKKDPSTFDRGALVDRSYFANP